MNEKYRSLVFKYARSAQIVNKDQEDEAVFDFISIINHDNRVYHSNL
jgi:hypothetical protein